MAYLSTSNTRRHAAKAFFKNSCSFFCSCSCSYFNTYLFSIKIKSILIYMMYSSFILASRSLMFVNEKSIIIGYHRNHKSVLDGMMALCTLPGRVCCLKKNRSELILLT